MIDRHVPHGRARREARLADDAAQHPRHPLPAVEGVDAVGRGCVGLGPAHVVPDVLHPGRRLVALDPEPRVARCRAGASSGARRRARRMRWRSAMASRNSGTSASSIRYSIEIAIGPLRGRMSMPTSRLGPAVERVEVELGPRRQRQPEADRAADQHHRRRASGAPRPDRGLRRRCPRASSRAPCRRRPPSGRAPAPGPPPSAASRAAPWR